MHEIFRAVATVFTCVLLLAGCDHADTGGWAGTMDTLSGGAVHVRNPERPLWTEGAIWRLVEEVRIGALESQGPDQLVRPSAIAVDGERRLWVTQPSLGEVRVFGPDGAWVRTIGRPGAGPGEFGSPWGLSIAPGGDVWVQDPRNLRYEVFDTSGAHRGTHRMTGLAFSGTDTWTPEGRFHQLVSVPDGTRALRRALVRNELRADGLVPLDTLPLPSPGADATASVVWSAGGSTMRLDRPIPFTPQPHVDLAPNGDVWVSDASGEYRIMHLAPNGDTLRIVERPFETVAVSDSAVAAALASMAPPGATVEFDRSRMPRTYPPLDALHVSPDGTLWVRRRAATGIVLDVFDPEGRWLGQAASALDPARLEVMEVTGDALYGVVTDELDVPYVVRLRIER